ncbi:AlpA family transcriptional regulator [Modestobacter sp. Leaf380]|uniref:helix-turn-helix transcriptional regulator n=1 Tax=Modestobacter sp. Leaf380 TaxID=1736356 RepID=UPI0009EA501D|nr:helix-turn-helix domain-containing protein [Modestobacter sp. Leaf380]
MSQTVLSPSTLSECLDVSESTLRRWRALGEGPAFVRVGRQVRYRPSDVEEWLVDGARSSHVGATANASHVA